MPWVHATLPRQQMQWEPDSRVKRHWIDQQKILPAKFSPLPAAILIF
jgi:hypothetical protein